LPVNGQRRVVILGSTGSIGRQAIDVVRAHADRFRIVGLVAGSDEKALREQAQELAVEHAGLGGAAAVEHAVLPEADVVLNAIVGAAGLKASVAALEAGKLLALANKESLVAGGDVCAAAAERGGGSIVPVDSEHAAIAQCLEGRDPRSVARIVLTASGGPFRGRADLSNVSPEDALQHPTWSMGPKITVDSATMMNKGLEVIEAHYLFGMPYERIGIVVHPQSVVHGIVELADGSTLMQAGPPDMRIPILAALAHPERPSSRAPTVGAELIGSLEFEPLDHGRFPVVGLAYEAGRRGRSYPAALNAANEIAVRAFLDRSLRFTDIVAIIEAVLESHRPVDATNLDAVLEADEWARAEADRLVVGRSGLTKAHSGS
jgi:1-deoxy-D-xylulose-5-phosphate reductoisomerase